ncbi:formimidoylglutamase [Halalkalibacillus sediminis]|uniref:Formimidoylglutamase n=1 Tax=Halalkalibacillus sediminis TaxID=2018042 RepID=A0A2I0QS73_9BACI|nr:formimidoylglutamase [Halalkalibacillus sediminis]
MSNYLKPAGEAKFVDQYVTKMDQLLKSTELAEGVSEYALVGAPLSKPSISHSGASFAPGAIRQAMGSYSTYSNEMSHDFRNLEIDDFGDILMHPTDVQHSQGRITDSIDDLLSKRKIDNLFVLGGDHSISASSIDAFQKRHGKVGVIQFDAHHDLRNLEDGGPTNGTPFRRLIEGGSLKGEHLVQIGIRDFTNAAGYDDYANEHNVKVYTMKDVFEQKIDKIIEQSLHSLSKKVDAIYISVDMDVLDQAYAPGCPAIGPGGMDSYSLMKAVEICAQHKKTKAMDIVEIDPTLDLRNMTSRVAAHVLFSYLKGNHSKKL